MHVLYYSPRSCSLAPHIVLEEIGEPYATQLVDATDGRMTSAAEWVAMNPKARVPALSNVEGSAGGAAGLLTEATAIMFYLATSHPDAGLLSPDPERQARALEWMNWLASSVHAIAYGQIWRPQRFVDRPEMFEAVREKGFAALADHHAFIESILADGRDWAVPGGFSIVEPYLLVFWTWGGRIGLDMAARFPAWRDVTRRTAARPAVRRVLDRLHLAVDFSGG